jgi:hypothetical protein
MEHGLNPVSAGLIDRDSDFAPLHGDARFERLVAEGKRLARGRPETDPAATEGQDSSATRA